MMVKVWDLEQFFFVASRFMWLNRAMKQTQQIIKVLALIRLSGYVAVNSLSFY